MSPLRDLMIPLLAVATSAQAQTSSTENPFEFGPGQTSSVEGPFTSGNPIATSSIPSYGIPIPATVVTFTIPTGILNGQQVLYGTISGAADSLTTIKVTTTCSSATPVSDCTFDVPITATIGATTFHGVSWTGYQVQPYSTTIAEVTHDCKFTVGTGGTCYVTETTPVVGPVTTSGSQTSDQVGSSTITRTVTYGADGIQAVGVSVSAGTSVLSSSSPPSTSTNSAASVSSSGAAGPKHTAGLIAGAGAAGLVGLLAVVL